MTSKRKGRKAFERNVSTETSSQCTEESCPKRQSPRPSITNEVIRCPQITNDGILNTSFKQARQSSARAELLALLSADSSRTDDLETALKILYVHYESHLSQCKHQTWNSAYAPVQLSNCMLPFEDSDCALAVSDWMSSWATPRRAPHLPGDYWHSHPTPASIFPSSSEFGTCDMGHLPMRTSPRLVEMERQRVNRIRHKPGFFSPLSKITTSLCFQSPPGCGLKSFLYCMAQEAGFRVVEINSSQLRSSKGLAPLLNDISQSHAIRRSEFENGRSAWDDLPSLPLIRHEKNSNSVRDVCFPKNTSSSEDNLKDTSALKRKTFETNDRRFSSKVSSGKSAEKKKLGVSQNSVNAFFSTVKKVHTERAITEDIKTCDLSKPCTELVDESSRVSKKTKTLCEIMKVKARAVQHKTTDTVEVKSSPEKRNVVEDQTSPVRVTAEKGIEQVNAVHASANLSFSETKVKSSSTSTLSPSRAIALILFEACDILFDDETSFSNLLSNICDSAKCPVVLTRSTPEDMSPVLPSSDLFTSQSGILPFTPPPYLHYESNTASCAFLNSRCGSNFWGIDMPMINCYAPNELQKGLSGNSSVFYQFSRKGIFFGKEIHFFSALITHGTTLCSEDRSLLFRFTLKSLLNIFHFFINHSHIRPLSWETPTPIFYPYRGNSVLRHVLGYENIDSYLESARCTNAVSESVDESAAIFSHILPDSSFLSDFLVRMDLWNSSYARMPFRKPCYLSLPSLPGWHEKRRSQSSQPPSEPRTISKSTQSRVPVSHAKLPFHDVENSQISSPCVDVDSDSRPSLCQSSIARLLSSSPRESSCSSPRMGETSFSDESDASSSSECSSLDISLLCPCATLGCQIWDTTCMTLPGCNLCCQAPSARTTRLMNQMIRFAARENVKFINNEPGAFSLPNPKTWENEVIKVSKGRALAPSIDPSSFAASQIRNLARYSRHSSNSILSHKSFRFLQTSRDMSPIYAMDCVLIYGSAAS